jgi:tetratricopeptide (TPR) repeat protein
VTEFVGWRFFFARQYDQMLEEFRKIQDLNPNYFTLHWGLGNAYLYKGMYKEAIAEFQKWIELSGGLPLAYADLGCAYVKAEQRDRALQVLQELKRRPQESGAYLVSFAWLYSCLGEKDQAFEWLERAYVARVGILVYLKVSPEAGYDELRSDRRYAALVRKMGLTP